MKENERNKNFNGMTDEEILVSGRGYLAFNVGDIVTLMWFGKPTEFRVVHKGYKTENKIVLVKETIETFHPYHRDWNNNYFESHIREYLNRIMLHGFSADVQNAIAETPVEYYANGEIKTVHDKLWLMSRTEIGLGSSRYAPKEGSPFDYFVDDESRKKTFAGDRELYWLRTPSSYTTNYAWRVSADGTANGNNTACDCGVVPAFEI